MAFRKDVLTSIGVFRSDIGRYGTIPYGCEETELCIRASDKFPSSVFILDPVAKVEHRVPPWRTKFSYFISRCYAEGISKALVTHYVGNRNGLRSERAYTLKTLPAGILRGISDAFINHNPAGLLRAGAILAGLFTTTCGFLIGKGSALKTVAMQIKEKKTEYRLNEQG